MPNSTLDVLLYTSETNIADQLQHFLSQLPIRVRFEEQLSILGNQLDEESYDIFICQTDQIDTQLSQVMQKLRDESHRFAITFHRSLRRKRTMTSELEKIEGVGPAKRKALIKFFGSRIIWIKR